ncbi:MAG: response regulator [Candidatus Eiseniibacteriota bacterium]
MHPSAPQPARDPRPEPRPVGPGGSGATLLVVEDDPRVVELLQIALGAHGFRVLPAYNGDDAWKILIDEQPDLAILDVRLPRRSGLDLCESIRREPAIAHTPIIMVSALAETEARLAGLARGADDYLAKPFSPKELVARVRRLLVRGEEVRALVRRNQELAAEVERSRSDLKRLNQDLHREYWVKDAFVALSQELASARRVEDVASVVLFSLTSHLGLPAAALLVSSDGRLVPVGTRGLTSQAMNNLSLAEDGELVRLLAGLARPVRREELERFPELAEELGPLIAVGIALCVALVTRGRVVGVIVTSEKVDGREFPPADLEMARSLASAGAIALDNVRLYAQAEATYLRALSALVSAVESRDPSAGGRARGVADVAASLARELGLGTAAVDALRLDALARAVLPGAEAEATSATRDSLGLERDILAVSEAYFAFLDGAGPGRPAPDEVQRFFEGPAASRYDRQVTQALDDLLRRGALLREVA